MKYALKFDPRFLAWNLLGDAKNVRDTEKQQELYDACLKAQKPLSPKEISEITELDYQYVRNILGKMVNKGELEKKGRGKYTVPFL